MNKLSNPLPSKLAFRSGGIAAWLVVLLTLAEIPIFMVFPQPDSITGWFELFQRSPLLGLIDFWGLELPMYLMFVLIFLALFEIFREEYRFLAGLALILTMIGAGIFLAVNNPFTMLTLSRRYAAAASPAERSALLAAGEAVLAGTNQRAVGGFNIALFLVTISGILVSLLMIRSSIFSRAAGWVGLLANGLSLADNLRQILTSSEIIALLVILPGALLLVVWFLILGWKLVHFGSTDRDLTSREI